MERLKIMEFRRAHQRSSVGRALPGKSVWIREGLLYSGKLWLMNAVVLTSSCSVFIGYSEI